LSVSTAPTTSLLLSPFPAFIEASFEDDTLLLLEAPNNHGGFSSIDDIVLLWCRFDACASLRREDQELLRTHGR